MRLLLSIFAVTLIVQPAKAQSIWRNFFTTNQNPIVDVVAGSNATVQASTIGVNQRRFTVNSIPSGSGQTNWPISSITNANYLTNWATIPTNLPAYLANDQVFTGSNFFTVPLTLSLATNTPAAGQVLTATSASSAAWSSMAFPSFVAGFGNASLGSVGTTKIYISPFGNASGGTTETAVAQVMPVSCYATNLYLRISAPAAGTNIVCELLTNGVASNLSLNVNGTGSLVQGSDTTHGVNINAGTLVSISLVGNNPQNFSANVRITAQFVCRP